MTVDTLRVTLLQGKAQHIGSIQDAVQTLRPLEVAFEVLGNSLRCFARSFPECRIPKGPERT